MKKFWIIDGSTEEFETKESAIAAAKRRAAVLSKSHPYIPYNIIYGGTEDVVYVYEAVALAREPEPDVLVEEIT